MYLDGSLLCDVDLDLDYYRRKEVIEFLSKQFENQTAKIITFNTLSSKLAIKEVGKVLGLLSEEEMTEITSLIPKIHGTLAELTDTYEQNEQFKEWADKNKKVYETALKLVDLKKNRGSHPSGFMICYDKLEDSCPVELTSDKELVSSFDMDWVSLFTIKLDLLGLRSISVLYDACKSLNLNYEDIDLDNPEIYQNLYDLKFPQGLFQIETDLGAKICRQVKPKNLHELSAVVALNRPGAMQFVDKYANYTNTGTYESIHPFFDEILKETGSTCLYQEQGLKMMNKLGFTLDESEIVRRIIGKKKIEEMSIWKDKIFEKCKERKLDTQIGEILWKIMDDSKSYSFNFSHSVSYASLCAAMAYIKFKYPSQFYLSLLKMTKFEADPILEISKIHKEMLSFGIKLLPPSLKLSKMDFSIENKNIRFGLSSIKGISDQTIEKLNNFKREHANLFEMMQCAKEAGLNIAQLSSLVQSGCMDDYKIIRSFLVYQCQLWNVLSDKEKQIAMTLGNKFDFKLVNVVKEMTIIKNEKGKPIIKESRVNTIRKKCEKYKEIYNKNKIHEGLCNYWYERKNLGYSYYTTLKEVFRPYEYNLETISEIKQLPIDTKVKLVGIVDKNAKLGTSKNGNKYAKFESISDETANIKIMIFSKSFDECKLINGRTPKEEDIIVCEGIFKGDVIFANKLAVQQNKIVFSFSDLKDEKTLD